MGDHVYTGDGTDEERHADKWGQNEEAGETRTGEVAKQEPVNPTLTRGVATGNRPERPARNAAHGAWVDYAVSQGADRHEAEGASRDDLIKRYPE